MTGSSLLGQLDSLGKLHKLTIIAPFVLPLPRSKNNIHKIRKIYKIAKSGNIYGVNFYRPWFFGFPLIFHALNDYVRVISIYFCIKIHRIQFDLIHAHYAHPPGFVAALLGKITKIPVIISCRGSDIHEYTEKIYPNPLRRQRVLFALRNSNYIITVSDFLRKKVISLGIPESMVEKIPNGVKKNEFYKIDFITTRQILNLPPDKKIILNVGAFTKIKGTIYLIEALAELVKNEKNILLIIIGDGPLRSKLQKKVSDLKLNEYVLFLGFVPNSKLINWYNSSDLFILPSLCEGFGIVIVEALSCGIPVVASDTGGIPEIINVNHLGILVPPGNVKELSNGILRALKKEWNHKVLIEKAHLFEWKFVAQRTSRVYERF